MLGGAGETLGTVSAVALCGGALPYLLAHVDRITKPFAWSRSTPRARRRAPGVAIVATHESV
jgi:hypothetical protein